MRIDLHCHTKATKKGDGNARNVTTEVFREKVANADVKIIAITNHNAFDLAQYISLRDAVNDFCQVWPGIEIDILGETKWHLIVVANPENVKKFAARVNGLFAGKNVDKCTLSFEEVFSTVNDCDVIYIPHFHKAPSIKEDDRKRLSELVGDESRVFLEPANHRSLGVYSNYGYRSIIGSDVKDWNTYDSCEFAELKLPVESFSQFCLLAKRDTTIVETLLNKKQSIVLVGKPYKTVSIRIKLFQDINIIFGPKGTGKTELIKSLHHEMAAKGLSCVSYIAQDRGDEFKKLTSISGLERDITKVKATSCENDFCLILNWKDANITPFEQYISWFQTRDNSTNKQRMKITEATALPFSRDERNIQHKADKDFIEVANDALQDIKLSDYLQQEDIDSFLLVLYKLKSSIFSAREKDLIDEYSTILTNKSIQKIKEHADRSTDTVSKPSETGLSAFVDNRMNLFSAVDHILKTIELPEYNEKDYLGELEGKGRVFVNYRYRFLCEESYTKEFDSSIGITRLKEIVVALKVIRDNIFSDNLATYIDELNQRLILSSITSIKPFLGISKFICDEHGIEYTASNGEQGILLLQRTLQKDADAYFLDEPELGMGGSYIDAIIRPLIVNLAKQRRYVVVATHNANIAVRTLPYTAVFRTHENGRYLTYIGNPFNDALINVEDNSDVRSWAEESLHTLEGSSDAFYDRRDIYESKSN